MKTIPFESAYQMDNFNDYYDHNELFKHFWRCSMYGNWEAFDFDEAFESCIPYIERKLSEHALNGEAEFIQIYEDMYGDLENLIPDELTVCTNYICISKSDVAEAVMKMIYEKNKTTFEGTFDNLEGIIELYNNRTDMKNDIILFDMVIHAEHVTGFIFEDVGNPNDLRAEIEEEYKEGIREQL